MSDEITLAGSAGEYMESATVVSWSADVGDRVKAGDVVVVVETAKAATEIEATRDGILAEILAAPGTEVAIGAILGRIADRLAEVEPEAKVAEPLEQPAPKTAASMSAAEYGRRIKMSPLARRLAAQAGLDPASLVGTGPDGRIKNRDVERALQARSLSATKAVATVPVPVRPPSDMTRGSNVPLVLIHGFGANAAAWNALKPYLDDGCWALTPELPGHGRAPALASPSFDGLVDAVLGQIEASGAQECDLVGHSLGGAVAAVLSANLSIRVRSLTLIAPAGLGAEIERAFLDGFLAAQAPESLTPWLELLLADPTQLPRGYAQAVLRERSRLGLGQAQSAMVEHLFPNGTQVFGIKDAIKRFTGPVKVIWGRADRIIPPAHQNGLPGHVACHNIDGVGHIPHLEAPSLMAQLVRQNVRSGASR